MLKTAFNTLQTCNSKSWNYMFAFERSSILRSSSSMASHNPLLYLLFIIIFSSSSSKVTSQSTSTINPFTCNQTNIIKICSSFLYIYNNLTTQEITSFYSVNTSQITKVHRRNNHDRLIAAVPCSCQAANGTVAYFYDTNFKAGPDGDTFVRVSAEVYSGQAWEAGGGGEEVKYGPGEVVPIRLACGCLENEENKVVVTYTVQELDTLFDIAEVLAGDVGEIERLNKGLIKKPPFIDVGWVLFVPMNKNGIQTPPPTKSPGGEGKKHGSKWTIAVGILAAIALLSLCTLAVVIFFRKKRDGREIDQEDVKSASKSMNTNRLTSTTSQRVIHLENMEEVGMFEAERPLIYSLEEIEEATNDFDETRIIGVGGYGSVYYGVLGEKEVAVKKMRSNKSKEFFAELKVLCKIHHINVVELLGFASGDDHLYLVYEFIQNGSLSHQPLSWTARAQIALDAAKGIEYIHDHTKSRYVHRDIKTGNILLDERLRGKVADFGLAKLVGRTNEDDMIATRLVGTPGYLPPESLQEMQVTTKTDVFAFGVVLAELITGNRALMRDRREPSKMKSLITVISKVFQDEDPETALESIIDGNLRGSYRLDDVFKLAELADWCLSEEAVNRPEMSEMVVALSQVAVSSIEWEASLGGDTHVFSGVFSGR